MLSFLYCIFWVIGKTLNRIIIKIGQKQGVRKSGHGEPRWSGVKSLQCLLRPQDGQWKKSDFTTGKIHCPPRVMHREEMHPPYGSIIRARLSTNHPTMQSIIGKRK